MVTILGKKNKKKSLYLKSHKARKVNFRHQEIGNNDGDRLDPK